MDRAIPRVLLLTLLAGTLLQAAGCRRGEAPRAARTPADLGPAAWGGGQPEVPGIRAERKIAMRSAWKELPPLDRALSARGEQIFSSKGCAACHTLGGGDKVGPDLEGITERADPDWVQQMILDPERMLATDPRARQLLARYLTRMADQGLTPTEARAVVEFLRDHDSRRSGT